MATFPALKPNSRNLVLGNFPQMEYVGTSGVSTRFLYGSTFQVSYKLTFTYASLVESDIALLYNHYDGQQGSLISFALPTVIWDGYSTIPVDPANYEWRYVNPLTIEPSGVNRFSTTVDLESAILY
jgi:hypothetical protein